MPDADDPTTTLYRTITQPELALIKLRGWTSFPARLPTQPTFNAVLTEDHATRIARDWNKTNDADTNIAFITRFAVRKSFLDRYGLRHTDATTEAKYRIPVEDLPVFNDNIIGEIEIIAEYRNDTPPA